MLFVVYQWVSRHRLYAKYSILFDDFINTLRATKYTRAHRHTLAADSHIVAYSATALCTDCIHMVAVYRNEITTTTIATTSNSTSCSTMREISSMKMYFNGFGFGTTSSDYYFSIPCRFNVKFVWRVRDGGKTEDVTTGRFSCFKSQGFHNWNNVYL